mgnify:CR=1 FL=1
MIDALDKLLQKYPTDNPWVKAIMAFFPITSSIDAWLTSRLDTIARERIEAFLDELINNNVDLTPELIESEDFLHCFMKTIQAVLHTRRREKIRFFARLLSSSVVENLINDVNEFEDYLSILDDLSYRELTILFLLDEWQARAETVYKIKYPREPNNGLTDYKLLNDAQRSHVIWGEFKNDLKIKLDIPENEIDSLFFRIVRTGCYEIFAGKYMGPLDSEGQLTPLYYHLKKLIQNNGDNN